MKCVDSRVSFSISPKASRKQAGAMPRVHMRLVSTCVSSRHTCKVATALQYGYVSPRPVPARAPAQPRPPPPRPASRFYNARATIRISRHRCASLPFQISAFAPLFLSRDYFSARNVLVFGLFIQNSTLNITPRGNRYVTSTVRHCQPAESSVGVLPPSTRAVASTNAHADDVATCRNRHRTSRQPLL